MNLSKTKKRRKKMHCRDGLLLIIDGSNLAYRTYIKFNKLKSRDGERTGLLYGFTRLLQSYLIRFKPKYALVTFDTKASKESNFKRELLGGYKAHRETNKNISIDYEDFNRQVALEMKILKLMNIPVVCDKEGLGHESDDYIAQFAMKHHGKVEIISSDKDFCQLLKWTKIKIYNPHKEKLITGKNCRDIQGYSAEECVDWLCLLGDHSDDIPGYKGMGEVRTRQFLDEFGSIQKFLDNPDAEFKGIDRDALADLYSRNKILIDFQAMLAKYPLKTIPVSKPNPNGMRLGRLEKLFHKYTLLSFLSEEFIAPFHKLHFYDVHQYEHRRNTK